MDEAVINGANLFYAPQFHIDSNSGNASRNEWILGLVNSAPYVRPVLQIHRHSNLLTIVVALLRHTWLLAHRTPQ
jgi:hypothetical protein